MFTEREMADLLAPFLGDMPVADDLCCKLQAYLELLLRWNARTNLSAIRDPREILLRHFGESLFAGRTLWQQIPPFTSLLDFGSGAGFPGIPLQLLFRDVEVTLAESQGKKAAFLREAVRVLELRSTVWSKRVEDLAPGRRFDVVAMRAVDCMKQMVPLAMDRVAQGGTLLTFGSLVDPALSEVASSRRVYAIPTRQHSVVELAPAELFHVEHP